MVQQYVLFSTNILGVSKLRFFISLYNICLVPIIVCGILKVLLSNRVWLVVRHLSWIMFHYYVKYFIFNKGISIINLNPFFCFLVYVVFLNCIQVFSFVCSKYYVHNVLHTA